MSDSISPKVEQGTTPTNRRLWVILSLITGTTVAQGLIQQGFLVLYPFIQSEFELSRVQVGLITSVHAIGFTAAVFLSGWLTDTLGVKRMTIVALISLAAFTLAFPLAYTFSVVLALAVLIGIVTSPLAPATTGAIMDWFPGRIRAVAMSVKQMGIPLGGTLAAAALPALAMIIGWRMSVAAAGLLVLVIAVVFILMYRDAPKGISAVQKFDASALKTILRNHSLLTIMVWGAAVVGVQFIFLSYFMLFLIEELGWSPVMAGGLLAIAQIIGSITRVLWGAASDFIFRGRRIIVLVITGFLTVAWLLGTSMTGPGIPSAALYAIAAVIGISTLSSQGVLVTLIGEQAEKGQVGVTIGVSSTMNNTSRMLLTPLFGYLVDISSSYSLAWKAVAALAMVCTLGLLAFGKEQPRH
jgi:MFS transporter, ACS family, aldohexuronate transporter